MSTRALRDTPADRQQIGRLRASKAFRRRKQLAALLEYLVSETMAGREAHLTQQAIAAQVFSAGSESVVRMGIARLREALDDYYATEAGPDEPRVLLPKRQYALSVEEPERSYSPSQVPVQQSAPESRSPKQITDEMLTGAQGVALIAQRCLRMGHAWNPTTLDAGIDGFIELRSPEGHATNNIILVQSKATGSAFAAETPTTFEFRCEQRDLDYWLGGNAPVILVRSRPAADESYWVDLKTYFHDLERRKTGKIVFNKTKDRFDDSAKVALEALAVPRNAGTYLGAQPKAEIIYTNLLRIRSFPAHYFIAATDYRTPPELFATLRETGPAKGEWILHDKQLISFHDLSTAPWTRVCDRATMEAHDTETWATSKDPTHQRRFVQLLNACLKEKLYRKGIRLSRDTGCYYVRATPDRTDREYTYQSRENKTSRTIFKGYAKKSDHTQISYYRHASFEGRFVQYDTEWFLQITPTYYFSRDGERLSRFAPDLLSGIKRLENNQAVHGQVVMWAHLLTERSLFDQADDLVEFGSLVQLSLDTGLDDNAWLGREESPRPELQPEHGDERQGRLLL